MARVILIVDYAEETERINERLEQDKNLIVDKTTYESRFNLLLSIDEGKITAKQRSFREDCFYAYRLKNPTVSGQRVFKKDEPISQRKLERARGQGIQLTERDLRSIKDINASTRDTRTKRQYVVSALKGGRVILAERVAVVVRGKERITIRDKKGVFVKRL